jgi:hypothetical protein
MTRKAYRESQVKSALANIGATVAEHRKANDGTLAERIAFLQTEKELESVSFDANSSNAYAEKQAFLASLKGELTSNLHATRILDTVGTENAKTVRHAITPAPATIVPTISEVNKDLEGISMED